MLLHKSEKSEYTFFFQSYLTFFNNCNLCFTYKLKFSSLVIHSLDSFSHAVLCTALFSAMLRQTLQRHLLPLTIHIILHG